MEEREQALTEIFEYYVCNGRYTIEELEKSLLGDSVTVLVVDDLKDPGSTSDDYLRIIVEFEGEETTVYLDYLLDKANRMIFSSVCI